MSRHNSGRRGPPSQSDRGDRGPRRFGEDSPRHHHGSRSSSHDGFSPARRGRNKSSRRSSRNSVGGGDRGDRGGFSGPPQSPGGGGGAKGGFHSAPYPPSYGPATAPQGPPPTDNGSIKLNNKWTFWYDARLQTKRSLNHMKLYEGNLKELGIVRTAEMFWRYTNNLIKPSLIELNANYHFFKQGIKPIWEDPQNKEGGKWVITIRGNPQMLDDGWLKLLLGVIGEIIDLENDVCGVVVSRRARGDRLAIWTRDRHNQAVNLGIGKRTVMLLGLEREVERRHVKLEFQHHVDSLKSGLSFKNTAYLTLDDVAKALHDPSIPGPDPDLVSK